MELVQVLTPSVYTQHECGVVQPVFSSLCLSVRVSESCQAYQWSVYILSYSLSYLILSYSAPMLLLSTVECKWITSCGGVEEECCAVCHFCVAGKPAMFPTKRGDLVSDTETSVSRVCLSTKLFIPLRSHHNCYPAAQNNLRRPCDNTNYLFQHLFIYLKDLYVSLLTVTPVPLSHLQSASRCSYSRLCSVSIGASQHLPKQ